MIDEAITARIAATKRHLLEGGVLQPVEWGVVVPQDPPDPRGRKVYAYSPLNALIADRSALDRGALSTERSDDTVLIIFDPLAVTDEDLFRWGDPPAPTGSKQSTGSYRTKNRNEIRLRNHPDPVAENGESNGWRTFSLSRLQRLFDR